eukprot:362213-Chlamydomonas_euryale.AAC.2
MHLVLRKSRLCYMHEGPVLAYTLCETLAGPSLLKTCLTRPPISDYTPASALAGPQPRTCMYVNAPRPPASGTYMHACPRSWAGLGLGRHDRPRTAASTHLLCTDHPSSVSHYGKRSGPLMHILHACIQAGRHESSLAACKRATWLPPA